MTKEQVIELAKQVGAELDARGNGSYDDICFTVRELERFATLVRNAAQEDADIYIAFDKTGEHIRFWTANKSHASEWEHENGPLIAFHREPPPSYKDVELAEMIMSDCGCSTNHTALLDRIVQRIARSKAAHPQATEPAGYKFVPVEPTLEMCVAGSHYMNSRTVLIAKNAQSFYKAMLAAAPEAP